MSQLFTATDVTATNGNKFIQVNTGDDVSLISPNSWIQIGNGRIQEVKTVNTSATPQTIELFYNWNGASGSGQSAISAPTAAEIKAAAEEIRQLRVTYEGIAGDVNVSAAANSIAKRDSNGRLKASAPVASDDVVNRGYFQDDSALDAAGVFHEGNSVNPLVYGLGTVSTSNNEGTLSNAKSFLDLGPQAKFIGWSTSSNAPEDGPTPSLIAASGVRVASSKQRYSDFVISNQGVSLDSPPRAYMRSYDNTNISEWVELYHSGNTNFNEFGGDVGDTIATGAAHGANYASFELPINSTRSPAGISVVGAFSVVAKSGTTTRVASTTVNFSSADSSKKIAVVSVTSSGSFTAGEVLILRSAINNSKITVNF